MSVATEGDLIVENELLTNEIHHLREQVQELEHRLVTSIAGQSPARRRRDRRGTLEQSALGDLRHLLGRLESTPFAPVLRRWAGYRTLVSRYLGT